MSGQIVTVAELLEERRRLRAALAPFAALAPMYARRPPQMRVLSAATGDVTVADLLVAAEVLEGRE